MRRYRRAAALVLTLALLPALPGCASLFQHDYVDIQLHADHPATEEDPSILRAETYDQLVNAIHYMIEQNLTNGVIHISNYKGRDGSTDVESGLSDACDEVKYEDPLGAYAVEYIRHETTYIVSYYEASIDISYRRTQEQVKNIVTVTGSSAIRRELQDTLLRFGSEAVLRVSYFTEDERFIRALIRQAYYDTPIAAMGMPDVQVSIYPNPDDARAYGGTQRIVEIGLTYPEDQESLHKKSVALVNRTKLINSQLSILGREAAAAEIFRMVRQGTEYAPPDPAGPPERLNTAYSAIVDGRADSEGMALAFQLYCQDAGVDSQVVWGSLNGTAHYWNIVGVSGGEYRHVDTTREDGFALHDADAAGLGYQWETQDYPACGNQPVPEPDPESASALNAPAADAALRQASGDEAPAAAPEAGPGADPKISG